MIDVSYRVIEVREISATINPALNTSPWIHPDTNNSMSARLQETASAHVNNMLINTTELRQQTLKQLITEYFTRYSNTIFQYTISGVFHSSFYHNLKDNGTNLNVTVKPSRSKRLVQNDCLLSKIVWCAKFIRQRNGYDFTGN